MIIHPRITVNGYPVWDIFPIENWESVFHLVRNYEEKMKQTINQKEGSFVYLDDITILLVNENGQDACILTAKMITNSDFLHSFLSDIFDI